MKAGNTLKLAARHYIENQPERWRNDLTEKLNSIIAAADAFNAELAANASDADLSPRGREKGKRRVVASAFTELNAVENTTIKNLNDQAAMIEKTLLAKATYTPPKDPAERITHELQLQEIRRELRRLPASERLTVYMTTSDPLVQAAIESAPMTLSEKRPDGSRRLEHFIDPEQRTIAVLARAERQDPESAKLLREIRSLREVYTLAVNSVRKEILDEVPEAAPKLQPTVHL